MDFINLEIGALVDVTFSDTAAPQGMFTDDIGYAVRPYWKSGDLLSVMIILNDFDSYDARVSMNIFY